MIERHTVIINELGLHARPAAQIVRIGATFTSSIELECDGSKVNGKSIMGVMMLAAECGATLIIRTDGGDEEAAAAALVNLVASGFGER